MNICIVAGARPNFVKVAPLLRAADNAAKSGSSHINARLVYAGREDDPTIEPSLFDDLQMRRPDAWLNADCENLNELTAQVMQAFETYLNTWPTDVVIVVDDLASTMAAAIVTKKKGLVLAHLVAGTRSFDISMPKEINRLVIDGLSDLLFTAGISGTSSATREGAGQEKIYLVGNILMDTLRFARPHLQRPAIFDSLHLSAGGYILFTLNRHALIANTANLTRMVQAIAAHCGGMPVVAPLRGAAATAVKQIKEQLGSAAEAIHVVEPLPYLEFGYLASHAKGVVTDSGNVAEEATFNGVPCITLNSYTEHIETVSTGTNVLVGEDADVLAARMDDIAAGQWKKSALPDRWDGRSAERILQTIMQFAAGKDQ